MLAKTFEGSDEWEGTKLVGIHNRNIIDVLKKIGTFPTHVKDFEHQIQNGHHETGAVDEGIIRRITKWSDIESYEEIIKGPQINVANPLFKTPRSLCNLNCDYDVIDLGSIEDNYVTRTNFVPARPIGEYKKLIKGFQIGQDEDGFAIYEDWVDEYKVTMRCMLSQAGERTLICAVLRGKTAHIHAVVSTTERRGNDCVDMAALCSSLPLDFYLKTIGIGQIAKVILESFLMGIPQKYKPALFARTLRLNCLTNRYADLWSEVWNDAYKQEQWSISDSRLKPFSELTEQWTHDTPLRNYFERRQALVEIDVLAAMALGLTLDELIMMYEIQFPVLQQNEADTWYDQRGNIVFTCSKGLTGVGLDRKGNAKTGAAGWEDIRGEAIRNEAGTITAYRGTAPTHTHTIDPSKSELYGGQQLTYYAPYTRPDRTADYRRAWAFFEERIK